MKPAGQFRFGCIILAAGASSRMGSPKQLRFRSAAAPCWSAACEAALASAAWPVVAVLGAHAEKIRPTTGPAADPRGGKMPPGPRAWRLRSAPASPRCSEFSRALDGALIGLCDQPGFSAEAIARLVAARHRSGRSIAAARYHGQIGAPALFLREHFAALAALTGEEGARTLA